MTSGKALLGRLVPEQCPGSADIRPFGGCLSSRSREAVGNWVEGSVLHSRLASSPPPFVLQGCFHGVSFQYEYLAPPVQLCFPIVFD